MASPLANAIEFFKNFGLFDVVLPFLLVFTIVFAILEKSKILGTEDGKSKKNLDSTVAFVVALLVVATNRIVTALNLALPNIVLLLVIGVSFLLLLGVFSKSEEMEFRKMHKGWYATFVAILFIGVVLIFLNSIILDSGESWLSYAWNYMLTKWEGSVVASIIFLLIVVLAIIFITMSPKSSSKQGGE
ncbi:MAG: hypothetical protein AB1571_03995 [Nanoarchaeota archaeon]